MVTVPQVSVAVGGSKDQVLAHSTVLLAAQVMRGGGLGGGPSGGCCCGAGSGLILFALIEIVLLPMEIGTGGTRYFAAESSCAAMPPPTCPGAVESRTIQISTTTWSPTSRPETRKVPLICSSIVPGLTSTELIDSTLALLSGSIAPGS